MNTEQNVKVVVSDKPHSVLIEMRPLWRICLILICISVVSGEKKYLNSKKINILVWMLIRKNKWLEYEEYLLGRLDGNIPLVSVDTATFKAVEFSIAKGFLTLENDRIFVTKNGEELFSLLIENDIMADEIDFLKRLGKKLTDSKVNGLTGGGSNAWS